MNRGPGLGIVTGIIILVWFALVLLVLIASGIARVVMAVA